MKCKHTRQNAVTLLVHFVSVHMIFPSRLTFGACVRPWWRAVGLSKHTPTCQRTLLSVQPDKFISLSWKHSPAPWTSLTLSSSQGSSGMRCHKDPATLPAPLVVREPFQMPEDKHLLIVTGRLCLDCETLMSDLETKCELMPFIYLVSVWGFL